MSDGHFYQPDFRSSEAREVLHGGYNYLQGISVLKTSLPLMRGQLSRPE